MGPPPPSPRIEGQQHHNNRGPGGGRGDHNNNYGNKPPPQRTVTAAPLSSYASLASAPPPSFARKTSTASAGGANNAGGTNNASSSGTTSVSAVAAEYHHRAATSPRGSKPMGGQNLSLSSSSGSLGRGAGGGLGGGRYDNRGRGGRLGGRGSFRGGGRGGRYHLSLSSSSNNMQTDRFGGNNAGEDRFARSNSLSGDLSSTRPGGRGGRLAPSDEPGGRFYRRGSRDAGRDGGRDAGGGRFDGGARGGRGRGRDYMYSGGRASRGGRSFHRGGRNSYNNRDEGAGRGGRYSGAESTFGSMAASANNANLNDNSYSSFGDNHSVGETTPRPRAGSFSDDLPVEGPSPGEIRPSSYRDRTSTGSSDGNRSVSPHPNTYAAAAAPARRSTYGSLASSDPSDLRRGASQDRQSSAEPGEEEAPYYPAAAGSKRRREEGSFTEPGSVAEDSFKRMARDEPTLAMNDGAAPPVPPPIDREGGEISAASASVQPPTASPGTDAPLPPARPNASDLVDEVYRNVESRLSDEGRWTSPPSVGSKESPHNTRRMYSGNDGSFDDSAPDFRDNTYGRGGGRGRGRGRGGYRGGRGGRGPGNDYNRNNDFGGGARYGDRRMSGLSDDGRGPPGISPPPRPSFASYSDLAVSTSATSTDWRRPADDPAGGAGPQPSPRGDWRKPAPPQPRIMVNSYATLASNPPPRPSPSTTAASTSTSPTKTTAAPTPVPEPEKPKSPPPSPGPPSGYTVALTRLADLEAQMEFAHAKHIMLVKRHQLLMAQYDHLEGLPVGVDAFQEELDKLVGNAGGAADAVENEALYG